MRRLLCLILAVCLVGFAPAQQTGKTILLVPGGRGVDIYADADYLAYLAATNATDGTLNAAEQQAAAETIANLKNYGLWNSISLLRIPMGSTFNCSKVLLKGSATETLNSITSSQYARSGATGGYALGSSRSVGSGLTAPSPTGGLFAYVRTSYTYASAISLFGVVKSDSSQIYNLQQSASTTLTMRYGATGSSTESSSPGFTSGTYSLVRTSSTSAKVYRNGTAIINYTSATTASDATQEVVFGGRKTAAAGIDQTMPTNTYLMAWGTLTGSGWDDTANSRLHTVITAALTLLSRN